MWLKHYKLSKDEQKLVDMSREEFDSYKYYWKKTAADICREGIK